MRERLHQAVKRYMADLDPKSNDTFRIFVRAYAAMNKIPQNYLVDFFARFTSADPHFDFTILLGQSSVEERIISELLMPWSCDEALAHSTTDVCSAAEKDHKCKHILVAACSKTHQFALMQPLKGKATLIQGVHTEIGNEASALGLPMTAFPYVFRT